MNPVPGKGFRTLWLHPDDPAVVQIIDHKQLHGGGSVRHRLVISDGHNYMQAMLATQLNHLVDSGQVHPRAPRPRHPARSAHLWARTR